MADWAAAAVVLAAGKVGVILKEMKLQFYRLKKLADYSK